ncbi:DNA mismatch repair endonuclease MutL [Halorubrum gandharaense]
MSRDDPPRVRRLDDATVDRIAAGEVVTRPARAVAELVDNALDADASRIEVAVEGDGTDEIRVADDGHGMSREDAQLSVARHATSKLAPGDDPVGVASLGFRGEALAALADAGRLEVVTNDGGPLGTRVVVDGRPRGGDDDSADPEVRDAGRARGTTVIVRDLFANRPARRDALASEGAEFARVSSTVADYALANPGVAFTLDHDGSTTLSTPGTGSTDALLGVYDRETASQSTTFTATATSDTGVEVACAGVLAYPAVTRVNRDHVRISVNGRPVRNPALAGAVRAGYGRLLPDGREPVAAVDVQLSPDRVDPNVHPAKREVGLRDGEAVATAVEAAVHDALTGADLRRREETATGIDAALTPAGEADGTRAATFADAEPVGQFAELYLLFEADGELLVVDQHAAHERVNYERLQRAFANEDVATAPLDPPVTVSLSAPEAAAAEAHAEDLAALGFETSAFGGGTVRLASVPAPFGRTAEPEAFRDAIATLADEAASGADARERLLADLACHPSLKRGDTLGDEEARALVDRLGECERPFACPHGRPTVLTIGADAFAAGFERER